MLEYTKDGRIKDFSIPDAHTLYVKAYLTSTGKNVKHESMVFPSLDVLKLEYLNQMVDPQDGMILAQKWAIDSIVLHELLSKGEASRFIPGHPLRFEYKLRKTKHADNLKHKG